MRGHGDPAPLCTDFEGGVDPAAWFGRGGAVHLRGTKDRVYVSHPDDFHRRSSKRQMGRLGLLRGEVKIYMSASTQIRICG